MDLKYKLLIAGGVISTVTVACAVPAALSKSSNKSVEKKYIPLSDMPGFKSLNLSSETIGAKYGNQLLGMDDPRPFADSKKALSYTTETNKEIGRSKVEHLKKTKPEGQIDNVVDVISVCVSIIRKPEERGMNEESDLVISICSYS